jgi:cytoskeletal protein RodZ
VTKLSKMTNHESPETKRSVYDSCDPQYLRQLRESAGMDLVVLARAACLSVAQVRQLESNDNDSLFYSDAIKRQAYKRLLMILGAEPPTVELPQELRDAGKVAQAHLNTLDQIVAMSHQPAIGRSTADVVSASVVKLKENKQVVGAMLLLVAAVALFVWNGSQSSEDSVVDSSKPSVLESARVALSAASETATVASVASPVALNASSTPPASVTAQAPTAMAVTSAPAAPIPVLVAAPASAAASTAANKLGACAYSGETMPELTSMFAQKEGRYVYLLSTVSIEVCVVDGNKQATLLQLKAGEGRSVYGASPWQLSGAGLQKVQIYFQGGRLTLPEAANTRFKLIEVPVVR